MLFLPESIYDARLGLLADLKAGKTTEAQLCRAILDLDPDDYIGMLGMGKIRMDEGDLAGAEEWFWRAIEAQPCVRDSCLKLAAVLAKQPESASLAAALHQLGQENRPFDEDITEPADLNNLPETSARRLQALRLIRRIQEESYLEPETVDAVIDCAMYDSGYMERLLAGVLRGWAQNIPEIQGDDRIAENALALLGETGSAAAILWVLEFVDLDKVEVAQPALFAFGRIVERRPEESARVLLPAASTLGAFERMAVSEQIIRQPGLDPTGVLLTRLTENIGVMSKPDRDNFFPAILGAMASARGREGVARARAALLREGGLLSRSARRECEDMLASFSQEDVSPVELAPETVTVYDICAGTAVWDDDEWGDDDDEFPPVTEPVRRKALPGRNEPCWCGSGRKYKKCHLAEDEISAATAPRP